jgi:hypothetical protein
MTDLDAAVNVLHDHLPLPLEITGACHHSVHVIFQGCAREFVEMPKKSNNMRAKPKAVVDLKKTGQDVLFRIALGAAVAVTITTVQYG